MTRQGEEHDGIRMADMHGLPATLAGIWWPMNSDTPSACSTISAMIRTPCRTAKAVDYPPVQPNFLAVHPYFDPDIPTEEGTPPTIKLISPTEYPAGSKSVSVRLKVSDAAGVHQVILLVTSSVGGYIELKACRGVSGRRDDVVQFEYDGVIPSEIGTTLFQPDITSDHCRSR